MSCSNFSNSSSPQYDVTPGVFYIDILSRDPPEAKICEAMHIKCLQILNWKSFQVPVYFSELDKFEVQIMGVICNVDTCSDTTLAQLGKRSGAPQQLTLTFDKIKSMTFEIEYIWKPIAMESWDGTSLSRLQQVY